MNKVQQTLLSCMEPTEPQDSFLEFFKEHDGRRWDKRILNKLKETFPAYHFWTEDRTWGMDLCYWPTANPGKPSHLTISRDTKFVSIDAEFIEKHNAREFSALKDRNQKRREAIADLAACEELEKLIVQFISIRDKLREYDKFGAKFECGFYAILRAYGIEEGKV